MSARRRDVFLFDEVDRPADAMRVPHLRTSLVAVVMIVSMIAVWSSIGAYDLLNLAFGEVMP